ncbi:MAG: hypothetical protein OD815_000580 [Candidatus Alkanophagales archaeon MCA70_species_2]|nr:hypothetical protein [Candidatus Alkanophaga liquidiphilum]
MVETEYALCRKLDREKAAKSVKALVSCGFIQLRTWAPFVSRQPNISVRGYDTPQLPHTGQRACERPFKC